MSMIPRLKMYMIVVLHIALEGQCLSDLVHVHQRNKSLSVEEQLTALLFFKKEALSCCCKVCFVALWHI